MRPILIALSLLAGCELCDHLEGPQHQVCEQSFQLNCDMNGDGSGDAHGTCDANQLCWVSGQQPGSCV